MARDEGGEGQKDGIAIETTTIDYQSSLTKRRKVALDQIQSAIKSTAVTTLTHTEYFLV